MERQTWIGDELGARYWYFWKEMDEALDEAAVVVHQHRVHVLVALHVSISSYSPLPLPLSLSPSPPTSLSNLELVEVDLCECIPIGGHEGIEVVVLREVHQHLSPPTFVTPERP